MRELFDEVSNAEPPNPMEAARRAMRPNLRKRFYTAASVGEGGAILLDGKSVRTPARRALAAPNAALAQALADEWNAQREVVDPAAMPLTRLANAIIDALADEADAVRAEIEKYLGSDLLIYRADAPEGLVARQAELWDPLLAWARDALGARFVLAQGIVHRPQPSEAIRAARDGIPSDRWRLGAAVSITNLTGSALIALALADGAIQPDQAWAAAHVDEDWQMQQWGRDALALERRAARRAEFDAAAAVLNHLR